MVCPYAPKAYFLEDMYKENHNRRSKKVGVRIRAFRLQDFGFAGLAFDRPEDVSSGAEPYPSRYLLYRALGVRVPYIVGTWGLGEDWLLIYGLGSRVEGARLDEGLPECTLTYLAKFVRLLETYKSFKQWSWQDSICEFGPA